MVFVCKIRSDLLSFTRGGPDIRAAPCAVRSGSASRGDTDGGRLSRKGMPEQVHASRTERRPGRRPEKVFQGIAQPIAHIVFGSSSDHCSRSVRRGVGSSRTLDSTGPSVARRSNNDRRPVASTSRAGSRRFREVVPTYALVLAARRARERLLTRVGALASATATIPARLSKSRRRCSRRRRRGDGSGVRR